MSATYDVVVIGSGANGLIAGAYMARAGQKVLVLERNAWFGGGVSTREVVAPGFRHDLHSATHIIIQANPLIRNDELGLISKFGLKYNAGSEPGRVSLANFAPSTLEGYRRVFDDFKYGDISRDQIIAAHVNSSHDPSRAPAGKAALTLFGFAPFELRGGGAALWDDRKAEVGEMLYRAYGHYVANLDSSNVIGWKFETPLDIHRYSPSFQSGDVGGVGKYFYQIGGHRPTPELSQYAVPGADGLYLAGTFMHPPGGVTGGGRATAIKMCRDLKIDFDKLVTRQ